MTALSDHRRPAERVAGLPPYRAVLWVRGDRSEHVADEQADAMAALFPRVRKVTIKGSGHWVHSEQPRRPPAISGSSSATAEGQPLEAGPIRAGVMCEECTDT